MSPVMLLAFSFGLFSLAAVQPTAGACSLERSAEGIYTRHLANDCSEQERDARSIPADELLAALKAGKGLDLAGVTVTGDLTLDALPETPLSMADLPSPQLRELLREVRQVRMISGPLTVRNSVVRGVITTNLKEGYLLVKGPVTITGTTFERGADFSRIIFLGAVDFSNAVFLQEAFFIMARFEQPARFEKTAFGVHTRFHQARFADSVSFVRAGFNGLGEFLQVTFEKDASFSRAYFKMGTGFSGSRFGGPLDFSEAVFERAAFFTFTVFEGDAYFRRATFRADANFSDAEFKGLDDFSKAFFNVEPRFTRAKVSGVRSPSGLQNPRLLYTMAAALFVFAVIFVLILRKR